MNPGADNRSDAEMAVQFERIIRKVKGSMRYRGSFSTRDILGSLVTRWVNSGEWTRLKELPAEQRRIGESVRRFILDRFEQLRYRGTREDLVEDAVVIPDETALIELIEMAELRQWVESRVADLEAGTCDTRVVIPLAQPSQVGRILRLHLAGQTQRQIADAMAVSIGLVNKRIAEGTNYLIVLQGIESGLGIA